MPQRIYTARCTAHFPARLCSQSLPRSANRPAVAEADSATSHAIGEGLRCQVLQRPARFQIFACDRFGGHLRTGGDAFTVSIRGASLVWPSLHDNEDGTYEVEWQASVSGKYLVSVMLQGEHIMGSPWAAKAISPGADPSQCRVRAGSSPVHAVAGMSACFDVRAPPLARPSRRPRVAGRARAHLSCTCRDRP